MSARGSVGRPETARIDLSHGRRVELPAAWLGEVVRPPAVAPVRDPARAVAAALASPIASEPLARLARPGARVALLVDDYTRKTPLSLLLPPVLAELHAAGCAAEDIRIVVASGTHRAMTVPELEDKLGRGVPARYRVVQAAAGEPASLVYLGTAEGIPAWVNREVVEADLRIGLGMITPHLDAGWSGGAKIVLPGICGRETVDAFHTASAFITDNRLGDEAAPLRATLEAFVARHMPLHFIVNAVLTLAGDLYACVAGDAVQAHRAGVAAARQACGAPARRRYPVVVADCEPYDVDLWQSIKGAWAGDRLVAPGGTLLLLSACPEGLGGYDLVPGYAGRDPDELRQLLAAGAGLEDAMQAATGAMWGDLRRRARVAWVAPGLARPDVAAMRMEACDTVEAAVAAAVARLAPEERAGSVAVLPRAGLVLPLVKGEAGHDV